MGDSGKTVRVIEEMRPEVNFPIQNQQENVLVKFQKWSRMGKKFRKGVIILHSGKFNF